MDVKVVTIYSETSRVLFCSSFGTYCLSIYMVTSKSFVTEANSKYSDTEVGRQKPTCACQDMWHGGKCLLHKAVHNRVMKLSQGCSKVAHDARPGCPVEIVTEATTVKILLCRGFWCNDKPMAQVYQFWWRICWDINVSFRFEYPMFYILHPFVTNLLTLPCINNFFNLRSNFHVIPILRLCFLQCRRLHDMKQTKDKAETDLVFLPVCFRFLIQSYPFQNLVTTFLLLLSFIHNNDNTEWSIFFYFPMECGCVNYVTKYNNIQNTEEISFYDKSEWTNH
jgi:hypothetical protein